MILHSVYNRQMTSWYWQPGEKQVTMHGFLLFQNVVAYPAIPPMSLCKYILHCILHTCKWYFLNDAYKNIQNSKINNVQDTNAIVSSCVQWICNVALSSPDSKSHVSRSGVNVKFCSGQFRSWAKKL